MLLTRKMVVLLWLFEFLIGGDSATINGTSNKSMFTPPKCMKNNKCKHMPTPDAVSSIKIKNILETTNVNTIFSKQINEQDRENASKVDGEEKPKEIKKIKSRARQPKSFQNYRVLTKSDRRSSKKPARERLKFGENGVVDDENLNFLNDQSRRRLIEIPIGPKRKRYYRFDRNHSSSNWMNKSKLRNDLSYPDSRGEYESWDNDNANDSSYNTIGPSTHSSQTFHEKQGALSNYDDVFTREKRLNRMIENGHPLFKPVGRSSRRKITVGPDVVAVESRINETTDSSLSVPQSLPMHPRYESLRLGDGVPHIAEVALKSPDYYENLFRKPVHIKTQPEKLKESKAVTSGSEHQFQFRYYENPTDYQTMDPPISGHTPNIDQESAHSIHLTGNHYLSDKYLREQPAQVPSALHDSNYYNHQPLNSPQLAERIGERHVADDRILETEFPRDLSYRQYDPRDYKYHQPKTVQSHKREPFDTELPVAQYLPSEYQSRHRANPTSYVTNRLASLHSLPTQNRENELINKRPNYDFYDQIYVQETLPQRYKVSDNNNKYIRRYGGDFVEDAKRKELYNSQYNQYRRETYPSLSDVFEQMAETKKRTAPRFYQTVSRRMPTKNIVSTNHQTDYMEHLNQGSNVDNLNSNNFYQETTPTHRIGKDRYADSFPKVRPGNRYNNYYQDKKNPVLDYQITPDVHLVYGSSQNNHRNDDITNNNFKRRSPAINYDTYIPVDRYLHEDDNADSQSYPDTIDIERVNYEGYKVSEGQFDNEPRLSSQNRPHLSHQILARRRVLSDDSEFTRPVVRSHFYQDTQENYPVVYAPGHRWQDFSNQILQDVRSHRSPSQRSNREPYYHDVPYQNSIPLDDKAVLSRKEKQTKLRYFDEIDSLHLPSYTEYRNRNAVDNRPIRRNSSTRYLQVPNEYPLSEDIHHVRSSLIKPHTRKQYQFKYRPSSDANGFTSREANGDELAYITDRYK